MGHVPQLTMRGTSRVFVPHRTHSCKYKEREAIWRYIMQENPSAAGVLIRSRPRWGSLQCSSDHSWWGWDWLPIPQNPTRLLSIHMQTLCNT